MITLITFNAKSYYFQDFITFRPSAACAKCQSGNDLHTKQTQLPIWHFPTFYQMKYTTTAYHIKLNLLLTSQLYPYGSGPASCPRMIKNYIYKQFCNISKQVLKALLQTKYDIQDLTKYNTKHNSAIVESCLGRCNYFRETRLCLQPYSSN